MTFKKLATRFALITFVAALPNISSAAVPHTFAAGDPIRASEVNANNSDLDQRQTAVETRATVLETGDTASDTRITAVEGRATTLESGATASDTRLTTVEDRTSALESSVASLNVAIDIDCTADADTFINTTIADNTTYTLSGICNGPIEIWKKRNVVITGNDVTGAKTDGIFLPSGLTTNPYAALGVWESNAEIRHLTIDATEYVTDGAGYSWPNPGALEGVSVGQMAILRIYDVDIKGGDYALNVYRQSYAKAYSNVNITGFNLTGVSASNAAHVELSETITVIGLLSGSTNPSAGAVSASSNSHVQIRNGGTFTAPVHASPQFVYSLYAYDNGSIIVKDGATIANFTSQLSAYYGGLIRVKGNATIAATDAENEAISAGSGGIIRVDNSSITGGVWSGENSTVRFESTSQSGGQVNAGRNGTFRTGGTSSIDTTGFGFSAGAGASISLRDTTSIAGGFPLNLSQYGTVQIRDTVSFGGVGITCQSQVNQVYFGANTTIGDLTGCPLNP
jgi:hypothetical protein